YFCSMIFIFLNTILGFLIKNQNNVYLRDVKEYAKGTKNIKEATNFTYTQESDGRITFKNAQTGKVLDNRYGTKPNVLILYPGKKQPNQKFDLVPDQYGNKHLQLVDRLFIKYDEKNDSFYSLENDSNPDYFAFINENTNKEMEMPTTKPTMYVSSPPENIKMDETKKPKEEPIKSSPDATKGRDSESKEDKENKTLDKSSISNILNSSGDDTTKNINIFLGHIRKKKRIPHELKTHSNEYSEYVDEGGSLYAVKENKHHHHWSH
ncbi:hypothetical protein H311_03850, partial [Anncaliia algerae PRA109]